MFYIKQTTPVQPTLFYSLTSPYSHIKTSNLYIYIYILYILFFLVYLFLRESIQHSARTVGTQSHIPVITRVYGYTETAYSKVLRGTYLGDGASWLPAQFRIVQYRYKTKLLSFFSPLSITALLPPSYVHKLNECLNGERKQWPIFTTRNECHFAEDEQHALHQIVSS